MVPKPNGSGTRQFSSIGVKPIPNRESFFKTSDQWLEDRKGLDGAEGLWRIHDDLYDLSEFLDRHPGGKFWLEETQGTDITEAFESHHISTKPEQMLSKFRVRRAKTPRSSPYTFAENGFYKTLKGNVREALKTVPKNVHRKSHLVSDLFLLSSVAFSILACHYWSYSFAIFAGFLFGLTSIAAHNYCHQRDSFRMYYSDIVFIPVREVRIIHVLSHHMYTNTIADLQAYSAESLFLHLYPHTKSFLIKYGSWIYGPFIMFPLTFYGLFMVRITNWIFFGNSKHISKADLLPLILPCIMYCSSGQPLLPTIGMWTVIIASNSFWYSLIGAAGTHLHPDVFMDGDEPRPAEEMDWGIAQLDAVSERKEFTKTHWIALVTFGDHAMHHLFPTLDHANLNYLYPVVEKTMEEFHLAMRMNTVMEMFGGFFRRLALEEPNPNPPNLFANRKIKKQ